MAPPSTVPTVLTGAHLRKPPPMTTGIAAGARWGSGRCTSPIQTPCQPARGQPPIPCCAHGHLLGDQPTLANKLGPVSTRATRFDEPREGPLALDPAPRERAQMLFGAESVVDEVAVRLYAYEVRPFTRPADGHRWMYIGLLAIPDHLHRHALSVLTGARQEVGYDGELHFAELTQHHKTRLAQRWVQSVLTDDRKCFHFHILGSTFQSSGGKPSGSLDVSKNGAFTTASSVRR